MNCYLCRQIRNAECRSARDSTKRRRVGNSHLSSVAADATTSSLVSSLLSNSVRMDFDAMVVGMASPSPAEQQGFCKCRDGYIPVMSSPGGGEAGVELNGGLAGGGGPPVLTECHDPIVRSAVVGSRCLEEQHCRCGPHGSRSLCFSN